MFWKEPVRFSSHNQLLKLFNTQDCTINHLMSFNGFQSCLCLQKKRICWSTATQKPQLHWPSTEQAALGHFPVVGSNLWVNHISHAPALGLVFVWWNEQLTANQVITVNVVKVSLNGSCFSFPEDTMKTANPQWLFYHRTARQHLSSQRPLLTDFSVQRCDKLCGRWQLY